VEYIPTFDGYKTFIEVALSFFPERSQELEGI
jgi:hypothetical protein